MEIRNIVNETKNDYPKMEQISKKYLENSIPNKWLKIGLSSLGITILAKSNVFAVVKPSKFDIAGGMPAPIPTPLYMQVCAVACPIVQIVSAIAFIITGLSILITKIKSKKQNEPKKVKKLIKVTFIISIIVFILSIITNLIINNIKL